MQPLDIFIYLEMTALYHYVTLNLQNLNEVVTYSAFIGI